MRISPASCEFVNHVCAVAAIIREQVSTFPTTARGPSSPQTTRTHSANTLRTLGRENPIPEPEPLLSVEVDRSRWLRGAERTTGMPVLRHPLTHHMCCMGFACTAAGHSPDDIDGVPTIAHLAADAPGKHLDRRLRHFENSPENKPSAIRAPDPRMRHPSTAEWPVTQIIYMVNDDETLTDAERELHLRRLGPLVGIDFAFTGEPLPPMACELNVPPTSELFPETPEKDGPLPPARAAISLLDPETRIWTAQETSLLSGKYSTFDLIHAAHGILRDHAHRHGRAARLLLTTQEGRTLTTAYVEPDLKTEKTEKTGCGDGI